MRIRKIRKGTKDPLAAPPGYIIDKYGEKQEILVIDTPRPHTVDQYHRNKAGQIVGFYFSKMNGGYKYFSNLQHKYVKEPDASIVDETYKVRVNRQKFTFSAGVHRSGV